MGVTDLRKGIIETFRSFKPERIILFGSVARKEQDEESDVDLIIVYETDKRFLDRLQELYDRWNIPKAVDILAYTPSEFKDMLSQDGFLQSVVKEGEIIYEGTCEGGQEMVPAGRR